MSTKAHFICENGVEGFQETSEHTTDFWGKVNGYNSYLYIENFLIKKFKVQDGFLIVTSEGTNYLPAQFKIWGDALLDFEWDADGLMIHLKGGHTETKRIVKELEEFSRIGASA